MARHPFRLIVLLAAVALALGGSLSARAQPRGISRVWPASGSRGVDLQARIALAFDRPMLRDSVAQALALDPFTPVALSWEAWGAGERLTIEPRGQLLPSTVYRITVGDSIRGADGLPVLDAPYSWSFTTRPAQLEFRFSSELPVQLVTPGGGRGVPLRMLTGSLPLDATLYALDLPAFAERYAALTPGRPAEIDLSGLAVAARWQAEVEAVVGQPGEVTLPEGTAPGLYVLDLRHETTLDTQTLLVYSDLLLAARKGRQGLTAWASTLGSGAWEAGARISLCDAQGQPLATVEADAFGLASFTDAAGAAFVLAEAQGQQSLMGLDPAWLSAAAQGAAPPEITGHLHTDRPIYRPGQTLHFKASLRRLAGAELRAVEASSPISLTIRDSRQALIDERLLEADAFGSVAGELALGDEVALGRWTIEARLEGARVATGFQVEEYLKPDFEVVVETAEPDYARSDSARVTVRAGHYHGAPVVDAAVELWVYRDRSAPGGEQPVQQLGGTTDAAGEASFSVALDAVGAWSFEAQVTDASRRPVQAGTTVPVYTAALELALAAERRAVELGQPAALRVQLIGRGGEPVGGRPLSLSFWRRTSGGDERERELPVFTDAQGAVALAPGDLPAGQYRVEASARDTRGRRASSAIELWIYDPADQAPWVGALEITTDRPRYAPGDQAQLLVKSPYRARALVTLEAAEVYDERVVELGGLTTVDFAIRAAHAPNARARVLLWLPQDRPDDRAEGRLVFAETALEVPPEQHRLRVEVLPDQERYLPGETARLTLRVQDAEGRPVQAQLSLALVDAALLALHPDDSGDLLTAFWPQRELAVDTYDGLQPSHWDARYQPAGGPTPGAPPPTGLPRTATATPATSGTATPPPAMPSAAPTQAPPTAAPGPTSRPTNAPPDYGDDAARAGSLRRHFPDTAYWNPNIVTDARGEALVELTLPDSLTTWQALARAVTVEGGAGQGAGRLQVHKPISADPVLPRFAVQGDRFALDVLARNDLAGTILGSCAIEAPGLFVIDPGERELSLPLGRSVAARWSVVASEPGSGEVQASLRTTDGDDALVLPFEVQPFTVPELRMQSGSTRDRVEIPFELPFNALPQDTRVDLLLSTGVTQGVLEGIESLIQFPHGCVEQTTSKVLPSAVVGRLVTELDLQAPEIRARLSELMPIGLQKLYGFQHADGSWGFFHGGRNFYLTSYVLHALGMIEDAGFAVDPQVRQRGLDWLAGHLPGEPDPRLRAYAVYVMAESGRGDTAAVDRLWTERNQLDAFSQAALALALEAAGKDSQTELALDSLEAMALREGDSARWPASSGSASSWQTMASEPKATALALIALVRLRPDSELAPMAARWLMEHRQGAGWGSTQATVFAVVALTDYMIVSGDPYARFDWRVLLDGQPIAEGRADAASGAGRLEPIVLTGDQLRPGPHRLSLEKTGEGTLYYSMAARLSIYHDGFEPAEPEGLGIGVARSYQPLTGPAPEGDWPLGEVLNVRLTVTATEALWYVIVEDLLPAGFEALDDRPEGEAGSGLPWRWEGYERKEVRDDRVTFFATRLVRGTHHFDYAVRAVTPGRFSARPAVAYAMYRTDVWGRSGSQQVVIASDAVAARPPLPGDFDRSCRLTDFDARLVAEAWSSGADRDLSGDGRVSVRDIAIAAGNAGLECGDAVPTPPGPSGSARLRLQAAGEPMQHRDLVLELLLDEAAGVGGFETSLTWPERAFELVGLEAGELLPDLVLLAPVSGPGRLRVGGYAGREASAAGTSVLLRLRLRPRQAGELELGLEDSEVVGVTGAEQRVSARGLALTVAPWQPEGTLYLPLIATGQAQR